MTESEIVAELKQISRALLGNSKQQKKIDKAKTIDQVFELYGDAIGLPQLSVDRATVKQRFPIVIVDGREMQVEVVETADLILPAARAKIAGRMKDSKKRASLYVFKDGRLGPLNEFYDGPRQPVTREYW